MVICIHDLIIPRGSYSLKPFSKFCLEDVWYCHVRGKEHVGDSRQVDCVPHNAPIIKPGSVEEQIVVEDNVGYTGVMYLVKNHIKACWSIIYYDGN